MVFVLLWLADQFVEYSFNPPVLLESYVHLAPVVLRDGPVHGKVFASLFIEVDFYIAVPAAGYIFYIFDSYAGWTTRPDQQY